MSAGETRAERRAREAVETALIGRIVTRFQEYVSAHPADFNSADWKEINCLVMMIQVKKRNPELDLQKMLDFDDFRFLHDFLGIARHARVPTGELMDEFLPRAMRG